MTDLVSLRARAEQSNERARKNGRKAGLILLETAEVETARLLAAQQALRDLTETAATYMDTGRGDLDGQLDRAQAALVPAQEPQ